MKLSLVVACSENRVIGKNNQLPWHLPADLQHFKNITMGKPILMGRKTYESIGKPLPGRRNVIVSRNTQCSIMGCDVFASIDAALDALKNTPEVMIIGGADIFAQTLDRSDQVYLTAIDEIVDGDAYFPILNTQTWKMISEEKHASDEKNAYAYSFQVWVKTS